MNTIDEATPNRWTKYGHWNDAEFGTPPLAIEANGCGYYRVIASAVYVPDAMGIQVKPSSVKGWGTLYGDCMVWIDDAIVGNVENLHPAAVTAIARWREKPLRYEDL